MPKRDAAAGIAAAIARGKKSPAGLRGIFKPTRPLFLFPPLCTPFFYVPVVFLQLSSRSTVAGEPARSDISRASSSRRSRIVEHEVSFTRVRAATTRRVGAWVCGAKSVIARRTSRLMRYRRVISAVYAHDGLNLRNARISLYPPAANYVDIYPLRNRAYFRHFGLVNGTIVLRLAKTT